MSDFNNENSVTTGKTHKSFFSKHGLRQVVSQKRVRFQDGEFDLDLSYICPNILAMGLPANGMDAMFRNNEQDVANMLNKFHPDSYMIYNLAQKKYDYSLFNNRVQNHLGWRDHHAPGLELLFENVNNMCEFLKQDFKNVVIVHCKAGKGRTGTSIAALLVYCGLYRTPEEALKYFSYRRAHTIDPKGGVTIPSQKRYIKYFANILAGVQAPNLNKYKINSISISGVPMYDKKNGAKLVVHVMHDTVQEIYNGKKEPIKLEPVTNTQGVFASQALQETELSGDIMLKFAHVGFFNEEVKFRISFNTHMVEGDEIYWVFYRHDLDDAYKDDDVPSQFKLELRMTKCGEAPPLPAGVLQEWQKALKNRHLYQNLFSKMSYQASTIYDPANNIGDTMDDVPNFLSQPQQVINGVILDNGNSVNLANMETWEQQQEERFLQEQAQQGSNAIQQSRAANQATSGVFSPYTQNPISPRMSTQAISLSQQSSSPPPALPRRPKPSLAQWEAYFQQHQQTSMGPASILGVMLQLSQYPLSTSTPVTPSIPQYQQTQVLQPPPQPPSQPQQQQQALPLSQLAPNNGNNNNVQQQQQQQAIPLSQLSPNNVQQPQPIPLQQPLMTSASFSPQPVQQPYQQQPLMTSASFSPQPTQQPSQFNNPMLQPQHQYLPPPPAPPTSPSPTQIQQQQQQQPFQTPSVVLPSDNLPPPPVPPTPNGTQYVPQPAYSPQGAQQSGYSNLYSGSSNAYTQQYQQLQAIGGAAPANTGPPLPRRPPMMPPQAHQQ